MKSYKNKPFAIVLISAFLLIGQFSSLIHSEKHPFHEPHDSCRAFVAVEHHSATLFIHNIVLPVFENESPARDFVLPKLDLILLNPYQARAPPLLS